MDFSTFFLLALNPHKPQEFGSHTQLFSGGAGAGAVIVYDGRFGRVVGYNVTGHLILSSLSGVAGACAPAGRSLDDGLGHGLRQQAGGDLGGVADVDGGVEEHGKVLHGARVPLDVLVVVVHERDDPIAAAELVIVQVGAHAVLQVDDGRVHVVVETDADVLVHGYSPFFLVGSPAGGLRPAGRSLVGLGALADVDGVTVQAGKLVQVVRLPLNVLTVAALERDNPIPAVVVPSDDADAVTRVVQVGVRVVREDCADVGLHC